MLKTAFSPELELLVRLIGQPGPFDPGDLDSTELFRLFKRHRLLPLVERISLQEAEKEQWERARKAAAMKALSLQQQLQEVRGRLSVEGLDMLALKGPELSRQLYGDPARRQMRDLDVYLPRKDLHTAEKHLEDLGYERKLPPPDWDERKVERYLRSRHDIAYRHRESGLILELHSSLGDPGLFDRAWEEILEGLRTGDREASFIYLTMHGSHHLFYRLYWLRDLHQALNCWDLDQRSLYERSKQLGIERVMGVSLHLGAYLLGHELQDSWRQWGELNKGLLRRQLRRSFYAIRSRRALSPAFRIRVLLFTLELQAGLKYKWKVLRALWQRRMSAIGLSGTT